MDAPENFEIIVVPNTAHPSHSTLSQHGSRLISSYVVDSNKADLVVSLRRVPMSPAASSP